MAVLRPCLVCGKPCQPWERNTDKTYAHDECLKKHSVRPHIGNIIPSRPL